jgi:hypothetical protein
VSEYFARFLLEVDFSNPMHGSFDFLLVTCSAYEELKVIHRISFLTSLANVIDANASIVNLAIGAR